MNAKEDEEERHERNGDICLQDERLPNQLLESIFTAQNNVAYKMSWLQHYFLSTFPVETSRGIENSS